MSTPPAPIARAGTTTQISPHVFVIPDGDVPRVPNVGIVVGDRAALVIDTGMGARNGRTVLAEARSVGGDRPLSLVTTHTHPEHDLGAHAFPAEAVMIRARSQVEEIATVGLRVAQEFARESADQASLLDGATFRRADEVFERERTLDLGGVHVRLVAMGANHTAGDTVALVIEDGVLFAGDIVMAGTPSLADEQGTVSHWLRSLDVLEAMHPGVVVPSHGPLGDAESIRHYREFFHRIVRRVAAARAEGLSLDETVAALLSAESRFVDPGRLARVVRAVAGEVAAAGEQAAFLVPGAGVELLGSGATWSEGPLWIPGERAVRWSDIPGDRILRWDAATGDVTVHREHVEFTNGRTLDRDGSVVQCSHGLRRIEREHRDGTVTAIVADWEGRRLNSPNDIAIAPDGSYWFTDPDYGIVQPHEGHPGEHEYGDCRVFRWDPTDGLTSVIDDIDRPNGIAFSPDGRTVYVTDTAAGLDDGPGHWIRAYDVDGATASNGRHFADIDAGLPDGIAVDVDGRVWSSAGDGIHVFGPDGSGLAFVPVPEVVANLSFGGDDGSDLFIAATTSLYRLRTLTRATC